MARERTKVRLRKFMTLPSSGAGSIRNSLPPSFRIITTLDYTPLQETWRLALHIQSSHYSHFYAALPSPRQQPDVPPPSPTNPTPPNPHLLCCLLPHVPGKSSEGDSTAQHSIALLTTLSEQPSWLTDFVSLRSLHTDRQSTYPAVQTLRRGKPKRYTSTIQTSSTLHAFRTSHRSRSEHRVGAFTHGTFSSFFETTFNSCLPRGDPVIGAQDMEMGPAAYPAKAGARASGERGDFI